MEALASGESALKLSSAIASARKVFREKELEENAELQVRFLVPSIFRLPGYPRSLASRAVLHSCAAPANAAEG